MPRKRKVESEVWEKEDIKINGVENGYIVVQFHVFLTSHGTCRGKRADGRWKGDGRGDIGDRKDRRQEGQETGRTGDRKDRRRRGTSVKV
jgi:hypothetical protein